VYDGLKSLERAGKWWRTDERARDSGGVGDTKSPA
jgi:hypothetical protein